LNRLLIPLVPAEAGTQFFGRILGPWIPAVAGMSGDWFNGGAIHPALHLDLAKLRKRIA
jgi:hypothetical protein